MTTATEDLTLMSAVRARAALRGRRLRFSVLAPVGAYAGVGTLRVLRATDDDEVVELVCGYESYVAIAHASDEKK